MLKVSEVRIPACFLHSLVSYRLRFSRSFDRLRHGLWSPDFLLRHVIGCVEDHLAQSLTLLVDWVLLRQLLVDDWHGLAPFKSVGEFLAKHARGEWGDLDAFDIEANRAAIRDGSRILSSYSTRLNEVIWVITEADRTSTCLLLPCEY